MVKNITKHKVLEVGELRIPDIKKRLYNLPVLIEIDGVKKNITLPFRNILVAQAIKPGDEIELINVESISEARELFKE